jgi:hypothetical protein
MIREVWAIDFEFNGALGECPRPICMVGRELLGGREIRLWRDELLALRRAPFDTGPGSVLVAYYASAEISCFLELGWPLPANIVDLFAEHRVETNGRKLPCGNNLLGALTVQNLAHIDAGEKEDMRRLILAIQSARLGKEVLEQYMVMFDALAQHYRPIPKSPHSDEAKFTKFSTAACECAKALAPYQSPTYRAIVVEQPKSPQRTVLEIRREDLARVLEERGLPPAIFGVDVPMLEVDRDGNGED